MFRCTDLKIAGSQCPGVWEASDIQEGGFEPPKLSCRENHKLSNVVSHFGDVVNEVQPIASLSADCSLK
jgi:hypothetical protein